MPPPVAASRGIARPTFTVLAGSGTALAGTLAVRVLLARALTPSEVGALILAIAVATALGAAASLGLSPAAGRRVAEQLSLGRGGAAGRAGRTALVASLLVGGATALALAAWAAAGVWLPGGAAVRALAPWLAPVCLGVAVGQAMVGVARGFGDATGRAVLRDGLGGLLRVTGVAAALLTGGGAAAVAVGFAAGALLAEAAFTAFCGWHGWFRGDRGPDREMLRTLPPYATNELLTQANLWMDILVLGALAPAAAVGYYGVARGLTRAVAMAFTAAAHSYLPAATALLVSGQPETFRRLYRRARALVLAVTWPVIAAAVFVPGALLAPLFGAEYLPGSTALRWLGAALLCEWLASFKDHALVARGDSRTVAVVTGVASVAGLLALLVAVPRGGAAGAGLAVAVQATVRLSILVVVAGARGFLRPTDDLPLPAALALAAGGAGGWLAWLTGASGLTALAICGGAAAAGSLGLGIDLWRTADRGRETRASTRPSAGVRRPGSD